jgi:hypothetical protein
MYFIHPVAKLEQTQEVSDLFEEASFCQEAS